MQAQGRHIAFSCLPKLAVYSALLTVTCLSSPAFAQFKMESAQAFPDVQLEHKPIFSKEEPVVLEATDVSYDQQNEIVTATGNVEVVQGETVVVADQVSYDQRNDTVKAYGNVSMLEPSGHVYFAKELELHNAMKTGVIKHFKARLSDNSTFVAVGAKKIDENITHLFKAAYTPCNCTTEDGKPKTPLWQMKADEATIDQEAQRVRYENAHMDLYGVPVFYTPYFSHQTPDADNQSGLLMPEFIHSSNLGTVLKVPVYYSIAADKDVTITPIYTSDEGPVLFTEYRQMFDKGNLSFKGSVTRPQNRDINGNLSQGDEWRGHVDAQGRFTEGEDTEWGFDIRRSSDETYLRKYNFSHETLLTSRLYGETYRFGDVDRSYASLEALSFQGLTSQVNDKLIPVVFPLASVSYQTDPGVYNSRFTVDSNIMALHRQTGADSRRLSNTVGWKLPYISSDGQILELNTRLRTDIYQVDDVGLTNGESFDGTTGRVIPEISLLWRYPFINQFESSSVLLEPVVHMAASPVGGNPEEIPNEDSLFPEFTESNLFDTNRFTGFDRVETGPRVSYGLRGQAEFNQDKYIDWLFGQHYRVTPDRNFPFTNDLNSHFSDYVGKVGLTYNPFTLAYRFRLDRENFVAQRSEVEAGFSYEPVTLNVAYLSLNNDPILASKEVIAGSGRVTLNPEWSWTFGGSHDLELERTSSINSGLTFKNECIAVSGVVVKDYTQILDIEPSLTFWFTVSLKNLD